MNPSTEFPNTIGEESQLADETAALPPAGLVSPYGGKLKQLVADPARAGQLKAESRGWPSWDLTARQVCDLELLLNGGFSPLDGFLRRSDYESVCREMRLQDGTLWPIPIVLDVSRSFAAKVAPGVTVALRDAEGIILAALTVEECWQPDRELEAQCVFGTTRSEHPGVRFLLESVGPVYLAGRIEGLELPQHHDFRQLRHSPAMLRQHLVDSGWQNVVAFQTRNPMHRAQYELTLRAARESEARLLIHPVVGMTQPGDVDHFCRVRCYQALLPRYPGGLAMLSLLPLSMRMAGPREALWHAIIQRNYGCSHLIVGRDHGGPAREPDQPPFHPFGGAVRLLEEHEAELGIKVIPTDRLVYVPARRTFETAVKLAPGETLQDLSSAEVTRRLRLGRALPEWFTFPEVEAELRKTHPPRSRQGFTVFFTGLSGAGKSTVAKALLDKLLEAGGRPVTMLDGDVVRKNLSSELGFSREHRDLNIRRIGFVANQITKNGGIAICAPIAPYDAIRREVRELISDQGGFILVHAATPLEVCEQRDRKGLYAKARAGLLKEFTGISDPYEEPADADVVLNTAELSVEAACGIILGHLRKEGYLPEEGAL